jgi:uncharacterized protein YgfB (UPF0149 family)
MARRYAHNPSNNTSGANIGFETELWQIADELCGTKEATAAALGGDPWARAVVLLMALYQRRLAINSQQVHEEIQDLKALAVQAQTGENSGSEVGRP